MSDINSQNNKKTNFYKILEAYLNNLSERERDILVRRFQISKSPKKETLKEIGDNYNITRERVRQIEKEGIKKLKEKIVAAEEFIALANDVKAFLNNHGGFAEENYLFDYIIENLIEYLEEEERNLNKRVVYFLLDQLFDQFNKDEESEHFNHVWHLKEAKVDEVKNYLGDVAEELAKEQKTLKSGELINYLLNHSTFEQRRAFFEEIKNKSNFELEILLFSYLKITKRIQKNFFEEWGLVEWSRIAPKKLAEKVDLIFERENKPLHFNEISEYINAAKFDKKNICAATVHNELISNDKYVLVGRGIYALKDWGYQNGTVLDVIEQVLKQNNKAMSKEEIFESVLKQRMVRKATIYLALMNKDKFTKLPNGLYELKIS